MTRSGALPDIEVRMLMASVLAEDVPRWLETQRWFADKGRGVAAVVLEDALVQPVGNDWLALVIARVQFRVGEPARYCLPLAWTASSGDRETIATSTLGAAEGVFVDATEMPWFGRWLLDALLASNARPGGGWTFAAHVPARPVLERARLRTGTLLRGEQSNTSLRFGDAANVKLVRRLQPGPNPDEEMLRALTSVGFNRVPAFAGSASWRSHDGVEFPIALAQDFVPNDGDGWAWMLRRLEAVAAGTLDFERDPVSPETLLGSRTGELHEALSQVSISALAPEPPCEAAIAAGVRSTRDAVDQTGLLLQDHQGQVSGALRNRMPQIVAELARSADVAEGFRDEIDTWRIRVHGDYHLGQTLRTPDGDWVLIDFEGEPARPVAARRAKTSALKDVAGMLRSFAYARGAAERSLGPHLSQAAAARLSAWEATARREFVAGYRAAVRSAPVPLVPAGDVAFANALAAWELDKALYEIAYEVRNRPDWLELPLRALLPNASG